MFARPDDIEYHVQYNALMSAEQSGGYLKKLQSDIAVLQRQNSDLQRQMLRPKLNDTAVQSDHVEERQPENVVVQSGQTDSQLRQSPLGGSIESLSSSRSVTSPPRSLKSVVIPSSPEIIESTTSSTSTSVDNVMPRSQNGVSVIPESWNASATMLASQMFCDQYDDEPPEM